MPPTVQNYQALKLTLYGGVKIEASTEFWPRTSVIIINISTPVTVTGEETADSKQVV